MSHHDHESDENLLCSVCNETITMGCNFIVVRDIIFQMPGISFVFGGDELLEDDGLVEEMGLEQTDLESDVCTVILHEECINQYFQATFAEMAVKKRLHDKDRN